MTDLNNVNLVGRITRDLDENSFGYVGNNVARANISIACNRSRKQADGTWTDDTSFFDITIWGKTAENLRPYLTKGKQVIISGYLKQDRWEKDGQKYSRVAIVADQVQLAGGRSDGTSNATQQQAPNAFSQMKPASQVQQPQRQAFTPVQNQQPQENYSGDDGFPEDIPF